MEVGPLASMTVEDFEGAMETHFYGPLYATMAVIPEMRRRRHGRIVNISSFGGLIPIPHMLPWTASKYALTGFSEGLRAELTHDNVLVTTACPGLIRTGSIRHAEFKGHALAEYRWFSFSTSFPLATISAERAARRIVRACAQGKAMLQLTPKAIMSSRLNALFPDFTSELLDLFDRFLPRSQGELPEGKIEGADLEPPRGGSLLERLNRFAAMRLNEYAH
jgi:short-subunit dehydrogenase